MPKRTRHIFFGAPRYSSASAFGDSAMILAVHALASAGPRSGSCCPAYLSYRHRRRTYPAPLYRHCRRLAYRAGADVPVLKMSTTARALQQYVAYAQRHAYIPHIRAARRSLVHAAATCSTMRYCCGRAGIGSIPALHRLCIGSASAPHRLHTLHGHRQSSPLRRTARRGTAAAAPASRA